MYSKSFMKFLINYQDNKKENNEEPIQKIEFKPVKVSEAAKIVITAIKDSY